MPSKSLAPLTANTGNRTDCWNTPQEVVHAVLDYFGGPVELDPCSNSATSPNIPCLRCLTIEDDGLSHLWEAQTVFVNHPYSDSKNWIPYARKMFDEGHAKEMILLIKLDISTKWFQSIADRPWVAINKRLRFGDGKGAAPFQSALFYLGPNPGDFIEAFRRFGTAYIPI